MLRKYFIRLGARLLVEEWNSHQFDRATYADLEQYGIADILTSNATMEPMFVFDGAKSHRKLEDESAGRNLFGSKSGQMMRLSQYLRAVEENLAELEKDFEVQYAVELKARLLDSRPPMKVTQAEREVDIALAERKGQIKYLTRLVKSGWSQVGVIQ